MHKYNEVNAPPSLDWKLFFVLSQAYLCVSVYVSFEFYVLSILNSKSDLIYQLKNTLQKLRNSFFYFRIEWNFI